jgi:hypothetical protein
MSKESQHYRNIPDSCENCRYYEIGPIPITFHDSHELAVTYQEANKRKCVIGNFEVELAGCCDEHKLSLL